MKKLMLALMLTFSPVAFADGCDEVQNLAEVIIKSRIGGMSQSTALQVSDNNEMAEYLVNWAYSIDLIGTEPQVNIEIKTFLAQVYITCKEYTE